MTTLRGIFKDGTHFNCMGTSQEDALLRLMRSKKQFVCIFASEKDYYDYMESVVFIRQFKSFFKLAPKIIKDAIKNEN